MAGRLSPNSLAISSQAAPTPASWRPAPIDPQLAQRLNALQPVTAGVVSAKPFVLTGDAGNRARALTCLTQAVYYEAASESEEGQRAVAQVVLNRVRHPLFPHSVCGVVYQGAELATGCQFSFVCDGSLARAHVAWAWTAAQSVARDALAGRVEPAVGDATHYHADYVAPYWAPTVAKVAQIGAHIFYRWAGDLGLPAAFSARYQAVERVPVVRPHTPPAPVLELASAPEAAILPAALQPALARATPGASSADGRVHLVLDAEGYATARGPTRSAPLLGATASPPATPPRIAGASVVTPAPAAAKAVPLAPPPVLADTAAAVAVAPAAQQPAA